jgi:hypothetical protein
MERFGLIKRKVYSHETPTRIEYYPAEKCLAVKPVLDMMAAYSISTVVRMYSKMQSRENSRTFMEEILLKFPRQTINIRRCVYYNVLYLWSAYTLTNM